MCRMDYADAHPLARALCQCVVGCVNQFYLTKEFFNAKIVTISIKSYGASITMAPMQNTKKKSIISVVSI